MRILIANRGIGAGLKAAFEARGDEVIGAAEAAGTGCCAAM